jgi:hypothetical protein
MPQTAAATPNGGAECDQHRPLSLHLQRAEQHDQRQDRQRRFIAVSPSECATGSKSWV